MTDDAYLKSRPYKSVPTRGTGPAWFKWDESRAAGFDVPDELRRDFSDVLRPIETFDYSAPRVISDGEGWRVRLSCPTALFVAAWVPEYHAVKEAKTRLGEDGIPKPEYGDEPRPRAVMFADACHRMFQRPEPIGELAHHRDAIEKELERLADQRRRRGEEVAGILKACIYESLTTGGDPRAATRIWSTYQFGGRISDEPIEEILCGKIVNGEVRGMGVDEAFARRQAHGLRRLDDPELLRLAYNLDLQRWAIEALLMSAWTEQKTPNGPVSELGEVFTDAQRDFIRAVLQVHTNSALEPMNQTTFCDLVAQKSGRRNKDGRSVSGQRVLGVFKEDLRWIREDETADDYAEWQPRVVEKAMQAEEDGHLK